MPSSTSTSERSPLSRDTDHGAPQPVQRARGLLFALLGAVIAVVALEVVFRVLPVSSSSASGYYIDANILTYPPGQRFTTATGWNLKNPQHHKANNYGFVADHDFAPNPKAVALIGDSFVEASMLAPNERLAAQLESRLQDRIVFAMGGPGSSLLDYAERIRFASQEFGTRDFVLLLEYGDVGQALCGSGNVHAACLDRETLAPRIVKQPAASTLKSFLRNWALPQYLFSQLKLDPGAWLAAMQSKIGLAPKAAALPARDSRSLPPEATQAVIDEFFKRVDRYPRDRLVLILTGTKNDAAPDSVRDQLRNAASRHGAVVLEPTPRIEEYGKQSGLSMHVSPADAHLNRIALGIVARQTAAEFGTTAQDAKN